jgi:UDP-N-acetylglucosamine 2-epimerase (non-hydrolysing)
MTKRVMVVAGTRPEVIKLAPVLHEVRARPNQFEAIYCSSGQHRQMLDQANDVFGLTPDVELGLMVPNQTLPGLTAALFTGLEEVLTDTRPDVVIVQGDTTTAFVAAMSAFYQQIPVGHIEAGLRTASIASPFPEEANRRLASQLTSYHFAPTTWSYQRLLDEGIPADSVWMTGNTVVDALNWALANCDIGPHDIPGEVLEALGEAPMVLLTSHRRESFGQGLANTCQALLQAANDNPEMHVVYPVHLNPHVHDAVHAILGDHPRIHLITPVNYTTMMWLMRRSHIIVSDSGGIQEEAASIPRPLLVLRESTERPETIQAGVARLVGTDITAITEGINTLMNDANAYAEMIKADNPFGDGHAATRIADALMT